MTNQASINVDTSELTNLEALANSLVATIQQCRAEHLPEKAFWIYLFGDLGTGKTSFSQLFIKHSGYKGIVNSPTYALVNDYETPVFSSVYHADLYRLGQAEELYEIGLIELAEQSRAVCLIEWPEKGGKILPKPNLSLQFNLLPDATRHINITVNDDDRLYQSLTVAVEKARLPQ